MKKKFANWNRGSVVRYLISIFLFLNFILSYSCNNSLISNGWPFKLKAGSSESKSSKPITSDTIPSKSYPVTRDIDTTEIAAVDGMDINFKFQDSVSNLLLDVPASHFNWKRKSPINSKKALAKEKGKISFKLSNPLLHIEVSESDIWEGYQRDIRIPLRGTTHDETIKLKPKCILLKIKGKCMDNETYGNATDYKIQIFSSNTSRPFFKYIHKYYKNEIDKKGEFNFIVSQHEIKHCEVHITKKGYEPIVHNLNIDTTQFINEFDLGINILRKAEKIFSKKQEVTLNKPVKKAKISTHGIIRVAGKVVSSDDSAIGNVLGELSIIKKNVEEICIFRFNIKPSGRFMEYIYFPDYVVGQPFINYNLKIIPDKQSNFKISEYSYERADLQKEIKLTMRKEGKPYLSGSFRNLPDEIQNAKAFLYRSWDVNNYNTKSDKNHEKEPLLPYAVTRLDEDGNFIFISSSKIEPGEYGLVLKIRGHISWCYPRAIKLDDNSSESLNLELPKGYFYRDSSIDVVEEKGAKPLLVDVRFTLKNGFKAILPHPQPRQTLGIVDLVGIPLNALKDIIVNSEKKYLPQQIKLKAKEILDNNLENKKVVLGRTGEEDLLIIWLPHTAKADAKRGISPCREKLIRIGDTLNDSPHHWRKWFIITKRKMTEDPTGKIKPKQENIIIDNNQWRNLKDEILVQKIIQDPIFNIRSSINELVQSFVEKFGNDLSKVRVLLIVDAEALPDRIISKNLLMKEVFRGLKLTKLCMLIYSRYFNDKNRSKALESYINAFAMSLTEKQFECHLIQLKEDENEKQTLTKMCHLPTSWWYSELN